MDVASSVMSYVKEDVDDLVSTFRSTNWTDELRTFGKAVQEETRDAMRSIEELPEKATRVLPGMSSVGQSLGAGFQQIATNTKDIFDQAVKRIEAEMQTTEPFWGGASETARPASRVRFNKLETDIVAMQRDSATYCNEPEDQDDFKQWKETFSVADREKDIEELISENTFMAELHKRIVPLVVEHEVFWTRYFYRLHKIEEMHGQRQQLAERTLRMHQEEEQLQWDDNEPVSPEEKTPVATTLNDKNDVKPSNATDTQRPVQMADEQGSSEWSVVEACTADSSPEQTSQVPASETTKKAETGKQGDADEEIDEDWGEWD